MKNPSNDQLDKFTQNQIDDFASFACLLERIHSRLATEGYQVMNGKIIPPVDKFDKM